MHSSVTWNKKMHFTAELDGHRFEIDAVPEAGGEDNGPRPKGLLLTGLAGCTAMDVIFMLGKKGINPDKFEVKASAKLAKDHPRVFTAVTVTYMFEGVNLDVEGIKEAVELSDSKFCGAGAMLKKNSVVEHEIIVNGKKI